MSCLEPTSNRVFDLQSGADLQEDPFVRLAVDEKLEGAQTLVSEVTRHL